jgi:arabinosaccharide transport system substrate-binding protein
MIERFPYGKAPFWLLLIALSSTVTLFVNQCQARKRPDLIFATFVQKHKNAYEKAIHRFEEKHGVTVEFQMIDWQALEARLQSAIISGADVPDLTEISEGTLGFFTRGPTEDIGFLDLTELVVEEGYDKSIVSSRYASWTTRGRIYALPHDVHPVMLAYRGDLIDELGIDVDELKTWEEFVRVGREMTKDLDGDGTLDRYMLDLRETGNWAFQILFRQRGVEVFDAKGALAFNTKEMVDTMLWYVHQTRGPKRIAYEAGVGQPLVKAMTDGLVLFYMCPDWRSKMLETDAPMLAGKMRLMPMPAWAPGERRTSSWGMTGLTISRATKDPNLAWELAKFLYFEKADLGARFLDTNIIPPLKEAWRLPELATPNPYWSGQKVGHEYAALAPDVPDIHSSPIHKVALQELDQALTRVGLYYDSHGDERLAERTQAELDATETYLGRLASRHAVLTNAH